MATLFTDFIKVAQTGPAIDGRTMEEGWIRDMAETYDPSVYTAMIWPEHARWFGNFGEVAELRAGPDEKGAYCLFARLKPNKHFLEYNAEGQGLFYSVEIEPDFSKTGRAYLGGLAVTDSPACLGMASTRFSTLPGGENKLCMSNVPFDPSSLDPAPADEPPSWFKKYFAPLFTQNTGEQAPEPEENTMDEATEARIAALEEGQAALVSQIGEIEGRIAAAEVELAAMGGGEPANDDPAYKALARQIGAMRKEFAALSQTVKPGTKAPANTAPANGKPLL